MVPVAVRQGTRRICLTLPKIKCRLTQNSGEIKEFIKCRLYNFSMGFITFILFYLNFSNSTRKSYEICGNSFKDLRIICLKNNISIIYNILL